MTRFDTNILKQVLDSFPEAAAAYLFGSAAKNEYVVNDLDILVLAYPETNSDRLYFELCGRIAEDLGIHEDTIDLLFFDLDEADPEVLYQAVTQGILLKEEDTELLTDRIEALSQYYLVNEHLIFCAKRLRKEMIEDFRADDERIDKFLSEISKETAELQSIVSQQDDKVLSSSHMMKSCKYSIIVITEAMAAALQHILAKKYRVPVNGYTEVLNKSSQLQILSQELVANLQPFVRFRNMLVHHFWRDDDRRFLRNLREGIGDFRQFVREIKNLMKDSEE
jgi:uncharacterized protein YutE (UPF0331/DUF86 family)/predicted nucleotidyltransferase